MGKKFIIAIPYRNKSASRVDSLLELLAITTENNNPYCDLCVYVRFDSKYPSEKLINRLREKFENVKIIEARPRIMQLLQDNFIVPYLFRQINLYISLEKDNWENYKSVLLMDENSCPVAKNWMEILSKEWDECNCDCVGAWLPENQVIGDMTNCVGYIEQNAMYSMNIIKNNKEICNVPNWSSWDTFYAKTFLDAGWQGTHTIRFFNRHIAQQEVDELAKKCGAVLINGVPDDSIREYFVSIK
jgi:hypothetical protein